MNKNHIVSNSSCYTRGCTLVGMYVCPYVHTHLVINGVKLGEKYPIDETRLFGIRVVSQCSVELDELVHRLVAHQSLTNKQDQVWGIDPDKLRKGGERGEGRKEQRGLRGACIHTQTQAPSKYD